MGFQDNLAGTLAGAEERPKFPMLAGVVTWQQDNVSSTPNGFRSFGLQVRFQLRRIVPVGLRDAFNWHLLLPQNLIVKLDSVAVGKRVLM